MKTLYDILIQNTMMSKVILASILATGMLVIFYIFLQKKRDNNHILFSVLMVLSMLWGLSNYLIDSLKTIFTLNLSYAIGSIMIATGLLWTRSIVRKLRLKKDLVVFFIPAVVISIYSLQNSFLFKSFVPLTDDGIFLIVPEYGLLIYTTYYVLYSYFILRNLFYACRIDYNDKLYKRRVTLVLFGAIITLVVTFVSSLILPFYNLLFTNIDSLGFFIFLLLIIYSIFSYNLFDIRLLATELIIATFWTLIFIRLFTIEIQDNLLTEIYIFALSLLIGGVFIRNALMASKQSQEIYRLSQRLK